jgi:hypothetical protein
MSVATSATSASRTSNISSLPSINSATSPPKVKGSLLQKNKRGQEKIPSGDPRRFCAFVVSIQKYKHINSLEECVSNDGVDLHQILTNHAIGQYSIDNFVHAINPSKNQLLKQLKQFTKRCRKVRKNTRGRITIFVYLAGHTGKIKGGNKSGDYLLCTECKPSTNKRLAQGAVQIKYIMKKIASLNAKNVAYFLHGSHATEKLQGIKAIEFALDTENEKFPTLTDRDKLTIKGIQHDVDHDILKHIVKKKQRKNMISRQKQLEKMLGTYIDLDAENEEGDDDDDSEDDEMMFTHAQIDGTKKKKKRKFPSCNIVSLTSCMQGQISRYGDVIHGVKPRNSIFGLHLCAGLCGRTIHQQAIERELIKKRENSRKNEKDREELQQREIEEQANQQRLGGQSRGQVTTELRPTLPPKFQPITETDEVFVTFDNKIKYMNRWAEKDAKDATKRGTKMDVLACGIIGQVELYSKILGKRRDTIVQKENDKSMKDSRVALACKLILFY